jgi:hypothetical protein
VAKLETSARAAAFSAGAAADAAIVRACVFPGATATAVPADNITNRTVPAATTDRFT